MNYYERHLGDYARDTAHLTLIEHGAYTVLLDRYYTTEQGIPENQVHRVARARTKEEKQAVDTVLSEFFYLQDGLWVKNRVQEEITKAQSKIKAAQENGLKGGRPKHNPTETQQKPTGLSLVTENETQKKAHQTPDSRLQTPDNSNAIVASDAGRLDCPAEKIVAAYHRLMPDNPECKVLNAARRGAIKSRWIEAAKLTCKPFGYSTVDDGITAWENFFSICATSQFLTGKSTPQPGKPPFIAGIDFLLSPSGFAKCLENHYHREAA